MNRIGDTVTVNGMRHVISGVTFDANDRATYFLTRCFDNSLWYAKCRHITRFTHVMRRFDVDHANLDKTDIMSSANELMRRIRNV